MRLLSCWLGAFAAMFVCQAAPFQDLNFDSANTNNIYDGSGVGDYVGPNGDMIPGWILRDTISPTGPIGYNFTAPGLGYVTLASPSFSSSYPVIGAYSFAMLPEFDRRGTFNPFSLSQTGDLPADVRSIHFLSYGSPVQLTANGTLVSLAYTQMAGQPDWNPDIPVFEAEGDLSAYAGMSLTLTFTTVLPPNYQGFYLLNGLDEISFSTIGVPEPSTLLLFSLGGLALLVRRFRR